MALVPNADVSTSRIVNNTAAPVRRGNVTIHLGYDADLRRAVQVVREATQATDGVLPAPPATARVAELGRDDLVLDAAFWTDSRRADFSDTASDVRHTVVEALVAAGLALPDPGAHTLVPGRPEAWRTALGLGRAGARSLNHPRTVPPPSRRGARAG